MNKIIYGLLFAVATSILFSILTLIPIYEILDWRLYDGLLHLKPATEEDEKILLLNIDDVAIGNVGVWPWGRDVVANGILVMSEFDARSIMIDVEYSEIGQQGVDLLYLNQNLPRTIQRELANAEVAIDSLYQAQSPFSVFNSTIENVTDSIEQRLIDSLDGVIIDNDDYFGRAARVHGNVHFAVRMLNEEDPAVSDELIEFATEEFSLSNVDKSGLNNSYTDIGYLLLAGGITPSVKPIIQYGNGLGFTNAQIDADGVRRKVRLFSLYEDDIFAQLAFSSALSAIDPERIDIFHNRVILRNGISNISSERHDIEIPLSSKGDFLVNWAKGRFEETFNQHSFYNLVIYTELENRLAENIRIMSDAGYLQLYQSNVDLVTIYDQADRAMRGMLDSGRNENILSGYRQIKNIWVENIDTLLSGGVEQDLLAEIDALVNDAESENIKEQYRLIRNDVSPVFERTRDIFEHYSNVRKTLQENIPGSHVLIGYTGTGTTDIGINPYDREFKNVGTHASVINTIIQEDFLDQLSPWVSLVISVILVFFLAIIIKNSRPLYTVLFGISAIIFVSIVIILTFIQTGIYVPLVTPILSQFLAFIVISFIKLARATHERAFIRQAFGYYLSNEVVEELLGDPNKLQLGGQKRELTAIFTDIKGFSTISERLDPTELVELLNRYLTTMSDIILDQRGTIDKYEGDAIIAFFGAPVSLEEHAAHACRSAILMKKAEEALNRALQGTKYGAQNLHTRIGINTGEMVVGNMGTDRKMNYTIMGNSVNLAARLEGVNKRYNTWILISEDVRQSAGDEFVYRRLDRVRVVGISTPVQLFTIVDEKQLVNEKSYDMLEEYHKGLDLFLERNWKDALKHFHGAEEIAPDDQVSRLYIERCNSYMDNEPEESWDGVYNLSEK